MTSRFRILCIGAVLSFVTTGFTQQPSASTGADAPRPGTPVPLAYKQEWKPAEKFPLQEPISQARLANPNLELKQYGAFKPDGILFSHQFKEQVHTSSTDSVHRLALSLSGSGTTMSICQVLGKFAGSQ